MFVVVAGDVIKAGSCYDEKVVMTRKFGLIPTTGLVSLTTGLGIFLSACSNALALEQDEFVAIQNFLVSQQVLDLHTDAEASISADLNRDGEKEIILVWSVLKSQFDARKADTMMTVLTKDKKGYRAAGTVQLQGQTAGMMVQGNRILIDTLAYADSDPQCCPSLRQSATYLWKGSTLVEVKPAKEEAAS